MTLASTFHAAACEVLKQRGERPTKRRVAEILGEREAHWHAYVAGRRSPSAAKISEWLARWDAAGYFALGVVLGPGWVYVGLVKPVGMDVDEHADIGELSR